MIDFARFSVAEQMQLIARTGVLIGVHGAALTTLVFTPAQSVIIEVAVDNQAHFANLAREAGRKYVRVHGQQDAARVSLKNYQQFVREVRDAARSAGVRLHESSELVEHLQLQHKQAEETRPPSVEICNRYTADCYECASHTDLCYGCAFGDLFVCFARDLGHKCSTFSASEVPTENECT
jgi:hypothetical protein